MMWSMTEGGAPAAASPGCAMVAGDGSGWVDDLEKEKRIQKERKKEEREKEKREGIPVRWWWRRRSEWRALGQMQWW